MNCRIIVSENFKREAKRLYKKYASLKDELSALKEQLIINPRLGTPLGNSCYKIRLAVKSKSKGKRGGLRIITYVIVRVEALKDDTAHIGLLTVYDKSEQMNISDRYLKNLLNEIRNEIHSER